MATIKDIARVLVERHKMTVGASEEFVQKIVEVINEGLLQDRIVKIKGFGTFKLQEVKERSSVNINTGEKVLIAAHDKITFTPDSVMRDIVNKPFAHFETVLVDGDKAGVTPVAGVMSTVEEAPVEEVPVEGAPVEEEQPTESVETPKVEETPEVKEEAPVVEETPIEVEVDEEEDNRCYCGYWFAALAGVVIAAIFFALGYFAAKNAWFEPTEPLKVEIVKNNIKPEPKAEVKTEVKSEAKVEARVEEKVETKVETQKAEVSDAQTEEYNKDPRVKYGAYYIIGTDTEVTVRKGQTLKGISKAYLGPDMECYVEAYNNKKEVKEGDKIRIPKLKVKKRK